MSVEANTTELEVAELPQDIQARAGQIMMESITIEGLVERVNLIKEAMKRCMVEGQHYGTVPGTRKPSLWKPDAELLGVLFQLGQRYKVQERLLEAGHIAYTVTNWDAEKDGLEEELKRRGLTYRGNAKTSFHVTDPEGMGVQFGGLHQ